MPSGKILFVDDEEHANLINPDGTGRKRLSVTIRGFESLWDYCVPDQEGEGFIYEDLSSDEMGYEIHRFDLRTGTDRIVIPYNQTFEQPYLGFSEIQYISGGTLIYESLRSSQFRRLDLHTMTTTKLADISPLASSGVSLAPNLRYYADYKTSGHWEWDGDGPTRSRPPYAPAKVRIFEVKPPSGQQEAARDR